MNLIGIAQNPEFWTTVVREKPEYRTYLDAQLSWWEQYCENVEIKELTYRDFKRFFEDGNRGVYEGKYFKRRRALLASATLSMIFPEEEKYLAYLQDIIFAICDEYTWCLPAHHPSLEENNNTFIDLFASETGFALAEVYTLLGDRLDKVICERIKHEINYRIITAFINKTNHWWEARCTNNWAAVCGGSVGCTVMLMRPDLFPTLKPRFDAIMSAYLSGFEDDGYCLEGTHYWHYGFGFFTVYADMVKTFTDGEVNYFNEEKVRTIATFIQKMFLSGSSAVSFADGSTTLEYQIGLVHYLKNLYPDDVKVYSPSLSYVSTGCARFCLGIRAATWLDPEVYNNPEDSCSAEYYGASSAWLVKRTADYGFAAKAGNNNEHHNHNDVGAFIFAKGGNQIITDVGRGVYSKQYFRAETRYQHTECSSLGHAVPFFGETIQKTGGAYAATDTEHREGYFKMDIAGAYGDENVKRVVREFTMDDSGVTLKDSFVYTGTAPITERFTSNIEPVVNEGKVVIDCAEIVFDKTIVPVVSSTELSTKKTLWFVDFVLAPDTKSFTVTIG